MNLRDVIQSLYFDDCDTLSYHSLYTFFYLGSQRSSFPWKEVYPLVKQIEKEFFLQSFIQAWREQGFQQTLSVASVQKIHQQRRLRRQMLSDVLLYPLSTSLLCKKTWIRQENDTLDTCVSQCLQMMQEWEEKKRLVERLCEHAFLSSDIQSYILSFVLS